MSKLFPLALFILTASTAAAIASEKRQLDSHEHGKGQFNIAFDGDMIAMSLYAPGADIVGFEYEAESAENRAKVETAVATLARPLDLFAMPAAAKCSVVQASASLEHGEAHDDHEEHSNDHAEHKEDHHDHPAHEEVHDKQNHAASHSEFHAEYLLKCAEPAEASQITFVYFDAFPNAMKLEVQVISDRGAQVFEVERQASTLDLREMF